MEILGTVVAVAEIGSFIGALIRLVDGVRSELKYSPLRTQERVVDLSQLSSTLLLFSEVILDPDSPSTVPETAKDALQVIHTRLEDLKQYLQSVAARTGKPLLHRVYYSFREATAEQEVLKKLAALEATKTTLVLHVSLCMGKTLSQVHEVIFQSRLTTNEFQGDNNKTLPMGFFSRPSRKDSSSRTSIASGSTISPSLFRRSPTTVRSEPISTTMPPPCDFPEHSVRSAGHNTLVPYNKTVSFPSPSPMQRDEHVPRQAAGHDQLRLGSGSGTRGANRQHTPPSDSSTADPIELALAEKIRSSPVHVTVHKTQHISKHVGNDFEIVEGANIPTSYNQDKTCSVTKSTSQIDHIGHTFRFKDPETR